MKIESKKNLINFAIIALVLALTIFALIKFDLKESYKLISNSDFKLIIFAISLIFLWQIIIGLNLSLITRYTNSNYSYLSGIINSTIASFFHSITPSSSGGQFIQIYIFKKQKVDDSQALGVLWLEFIIYQSVMCFFILFLLLSNFKFFYNRHRDWFVLIIINFIINILIVLTIFALAKLSLFHKLITKDLINFLHKIKIVKNPDKLRDKLENKVTSFKRFSSLYINNHQLCIISIILNILRCFVYYSIPYVIFLALGVKASISTFIICLTLSSFVSMLSNLIPTPGGSLGSEAVFLLLFSSLFNLNLVTSAMLIWRFITYYLLLLISGTIYLFYKFLWRKTCE